LPAIAEISALEGEEGGEMNVKFNKYNVSDGKIKARVFYAIDNRIDGKRCVTIYAKDHTGDLHKIFDNEVIDTDYFEKGRVVLFQDHPLYPAALAKALINHPPR